MIRFAMSLSRIFKIGYWVVALTLTIVVVANMSAYVNRPPPHTWDEVSRFVRRRWQPGDEILFKPRWLAGYAFDKNRYAGLRTADQTLSSTKKLVPEVRCWLVLVEPLEDLGIPDELTLEQIATKTFGSVNVYLVKPHAAPPDE